MAFTLTLLGTDTQFTREANTQSYQKGETLSFVSALIEEQGLETGAPGEHLNSKSQVVIDGPTTLGSEVGDRIARGVFFILQAIARGETQINILAHSRGAVEAILVAHELQRIQDLFRAPLTPSITAITTSPCSLTKTAMQPLNDRFNLNLGAVAQNIHRVRLATFLIDPVPGGSLFGLGSVLAWVDKRYYQLPPIVAECEQYVYENERSRCFKAIIPKSPPSSFKLTALPGHHGTGSGNLNDQQGRTVSQELGTTEHVQQLLILKLIDFLKRNQVMFKAPGQRAGHPELLSLVSAPLNDSSDNHSFQAQYLQLYHEIAKNRAAYRSFNNTSYAYLTQEGSIAALWTGTLNGRVVHNGNRDDAFLPNIIPTLSHQYFVNEEHRSLLLSTSPNTEPKSLIEEIKSTTNQLLKIVHTDAQHTNPNGPTDLTASQSAPILADLCASDANNIDQMITGRLRPLIYKISQAYLRDELIEEEGKANSDLFETIKASFTKFLEVAATTASSVAAPASSVAAAASSVAAEELPTTAGKKNHALAVKIIDTLTQELISALRAKKDMLIQESDSVFSGSEEDTLRPSENRLRACLEACQKLNAFIEHKHFSTLGISFNYEGMKNELKKTKALLMQEAAHYITRQSYPLQKFEALCGPENQALYKEVSGLAIGVGAQDVHAIELSERSSQLSQENATLRAEIDQTRATHEKLARDASAQYNHFKEQIRRLKKDLKSGEHNLNEHIKLLKDLELSNHNLNEQTTHLQSEFDRLKSINQNENEAKFLLLIKEKLLPETTQYLSHLWKKATAPNQAENISAEEMARALREKINSLPTDNLLKQKSEAVLSLYEQLTLPHSDPSHHQRVLRFYQTLKEKNTCLKQHQDPSWRRYVIGVSIILTGVLPGLAVLALISATTGKSMKFWESQGEAFFKKCHKEAANASTLFAQFNSGNSNPILPPDSSPGTLA